MSEEANATGLKPCPFCGSEGRTVYATHVAVNADPEQEGYANCPNSHCMLSNIAMFADEWNTRADAGYEAGRASLWTKIALADDLPKVDARYQVTTRAGNVLNVRRYTTEPADTEHWLKCYIAWMPIPPPFKEK